LSSDLASLIFDRTLSAPKLNFFSFELIPFYPPKKDDDSSKDPTIFFYSSKELLLMLISYFDDDVCSLVLKSKGLRELNYPLFH
jgi:hypothetical protein